MSFHLYNELDLPENGCIDCSLVCILDIVQSSGKERRGDLVSGFCFSSFGKFPLFLGFLLLLGFKSYWGFNFMWKLKLNSTCSAFFYSGFNSSGVSRVLGYFGLRFFSLSCGKFSV